MKKAAQACKELMQTYPQSLTVLNVLGSALAGQGQLQQAVQVFDNMIRLKPNLAEAYINRGVALTELGRLEMAMENYDKIIGPISFLGKYSHADISDGGGVGSDTKKPILTIIAA